MYIYLVKQHQTSSEYDNYIVDAFDSEDKARDKAREYNKEYAYNAGINELGDFTGDLYTDDDMGDYHYYDYFSLEVNNMDYKNSNIEYVPLADVYLSGNDLDVCRKNKWVIDNPIPFNTGAKSTVYVRKSSNKAECLVFFTLFIRDVLNKEPIDVYGDFY